MFTAFKYFNLYENGTSWPTEKEIITCLTFLITEIGFWPETLVGNNTEKLNFVIKNQK